MKRCCIIAFLLGLLGALIDTWSLGWLIPIKRPLIRWIVSWPAPNFAGWLNLYSLYLVRLLMVLVAAIVIRIWVKKHQVASYLSFAVGLHVMGFFWTVVFVVRNVGFNWKVHLSTISHDLVVIALGMVALLAFRRKHVVRGFEPVLQPDTPTRDAAASE